ncbi:preprotein translocase subunit YajC [Clostridium sp. BSD2780061688b_171218_E8]|jgi:preprotein translocase subunit YajC|uniref:preprotein translocase subunit YajC n=2 Tax=Bacillota TaxID=1239 RepID=UPI001FAD54A9|nr:preprotein translocase subunit YajC [Clostridium sp. BSD2780061688b_171218_E8]
MPGLLQNLMPIAEAAGVSVEQSNQFLNILVNIGPIVLLVVLFYFFLIRPQQKREKKTKEMLASIKAGDRITTIGGIYARVVEAHDDVLVVEVGADKTKLMIARWAVRNLEDSDADNEMIKPE